MKTFRFVSLFFALVLTSVFVLTTCKDAIGLGEAVDINPPIIRSESIYPPLNAVVRDSFLLSVAVEDDRKVQTVSALLTCMEDGGYSHQFLLEQHNNRWEVYIDRTKDHTKYKPVDGRYMLRITAKDASGKEADIESSLVIDNTPPLLVLQRPSTAMTGAPEAGAADIFGDVFFLAGQVYDSCPVESLSLTAQPAGGGEPKTHILKNIPQTIRMTVDAFSSQNAGFYKGIYGTNKYAGNQVFSYNIKVTDSARLYQDTQNREGSGEGNSTETYYLYEDLYKDVLSKYKIDKVYNMTRKSYSNGRSVGAIDSGDVQQVLDTLKKAALNKGGEKKGVFTLNPSINPKYGIEGHSPKTIPESGSLIDLFDEIYEDSAITVKLSPNFDEDPLNNAETYEFYVIDLETYKNAAGSYAIDVNDDGKLYADDSQTTLRQGITKIEKSQIIKIGKSGSSHIITIKLPRLAYRTNYILQARGSDQKSAKHTMIADPKESNGSMYGFKVKKNGKIPEVSVKKINGREADNGRFYIKKGDSVSFNAEIGSSVTGTVYYTLTGGNNTAVPASQDYTPSGSGSVAFTIPKETFIQDKSTPYKLTVKAEDGEGKGTSLPAECQIYYDVEGPVITANAPGLVTEMPDISGDIYDAGAGVKFDSIKATYQYESDAVQNLSFAQPATKDNNSWKLSPIQNPKEGAYTIVLTAQDALDQPGKDTKLTFIYDTAKPSIRELNNVAIDLLRKGQKLQTDSASFTLTGKIREKNKIKTLKIGKKDGQKEDVSFSADSGSSDTYTFTKTFDSMPDGDCTFSIDVEDTAGKTDSAEITAVVDTAAPQFKKMKIARHEFTVTTNSNPFNGSIDRVTTRAAIVPISGEFEDQGQGVKKLIVKWVEGSEQKQEEFTAVPIEGQPGRYKAEGAITLALMQSDVTFTIQDGSNKTTDWKTAIIRLNEKLAVDIKMIEPATPPYKYADTPYVKTVFKLQLTSSYNGEQPQDLELYISKDGSPLSDQALTALQYQVEKDGASITNMQKKESAICGFKSGVKTKENELYTVTVTPRTSHEDDGQYLFVFKDTAGDVQKQQRVWIDTKAPDFTPRVPVEGQALKEEPKFFAVLSDTPGAGIKTVTAQLNNTTIALEQKGSSIESKEALKLQEGKNTITLTYQDHLENAGSNTITFDYDVTAPVLSDITVNGKNSDTVLVGVDSSSNKMKSFTVSGKVKDNINMDAVYLTITNKTTGKSAERQKCAITGSTEQNFSWTVTADTLQNIISGGDDYTLSIRAEDKAGLIKTVVKTVQVDKVPPQIMVQTPTAGSTVNKTITVSGTASDTQKLKSISVVTTEQSGNPVTNTVAADDKAVSWRFQLDTTKYAAETGSLNFKIIAEDEVGNKTEKTETIQIDQHKDRPVITITEFAHIASAKLSNATILTGTISDDDGQLKDLTKDLQIKIDSGAYTPVKFGSGGNLWVHDLGNLADGNHTINFKVTDAAGTSFCTESGSTNKIACPKVAGKSDPVTIAQDTAISFQLDNTPPAIKSDDVRFVLGSSWTSSNDGTAITQNAKIGNGANDENKKACFRVFVKDSSGIDTVKLFLESNQAHSLTHNAAKDIKTSSGTAVEWEAWEAAAVPLVEGSQVLKIEVKDKSDFPKFWQETVVCDFTKPTVTMQNPPQESDNWAKELLIGKTLLSGSFLDTSSGIDKDKTKYSCKIGTAKKDLLASDTFEVGASGLSWKIELADASLYGTNTYTSERLKSDLTADANGKIYKVPLYLTAQDIAGNTQEQEFYLTIDSDGKTPKVSIYGPEQPPTKAQNGGDAHNGFEKVTLGGNVLFLGNAAVNKPSSGAKVVSLEARFSEQPDFNKPFKKEISAGLPNQGSTKDWKDGVEVVTNASGINSWNFSIDSSKFLKDISTGNIDLYYSLRAKNNEGNYCDWTPARKIRLDQNAPIFHHPKIQKGSESVDYVSGKSVSEGQYLIADLISTTGISKISVEVAYAGTMYNGLANLTDSSKILAAKVGSETVFTACTKDGKSGYTMKLPLKTKSMTDSDQNCRIKINLTGNTANGSNPANFNQFNLKYDNTKPAVVFGVPEGEGGLGVFSANSASGVDTAKTGMDTTNLYVFVATKDGCAKEIKVTGTGDKTLNYASQSGDIFDSKSEYILFRKKPVVFDNSETYQLQGIIYDTGSGVACVTPAADSNASFGTPCEITQFTSLQGQFSSFKQGVTTKTLADGKHNLKLKVRDKAGNDGTEYTTQVFLRNKPLKIAKVTFKTDLNGNNAYADDADKGLVELVAETGDSKKVTDEKNYCQTLDITDQFTFKNAVKSQIAFELEGGEGTTRNFELYKTDGSGKPTGAAIKSGSFTGNGEIDLNAADFAAEKIPQGEKQTFALVLKDDASTSDTDDSDHTGRKLTLTVKLNVKTQDSSKPQVEIMPFYWNGEADNSLYNNSRENGHIEITKVSGGAGASGTGTSNTAVSDVSGKVVLRGTAYHPTKLTKLQLDGVDTTPTADYTSGTWNTSTGLTVTDTAFDVHGHWVRWEYTWTTSTPTMSKAITLKAFHDTVESLTSAGSVVKGTATARTEQSATLASGDTAVVGQFLRLYSGDQSYLVTISSVKDSVVEWKNKLVPTAIKEYQLYSIKYTTKTSGDIVPEYSHGSLTVNVVPYVSKIETFISDTAGEEFARSALGAYPVHTGETIKLRGFNLTEKPDVTMHSKKLKVGNKETDGNGSYYPVTVTYDSTSSSTEEVKSGDLTVTVHSVQAINNSNTVPTFDDKGNPLTAAYNVQANDAHKRLTDNLSLSVWKIEGMGIQKDITSPMLKVDSDSNWYMSYGKGVPAMVVNRNGTETIVDYSYNKFHNTAVAFDKSQNVYAVATNTDRVVDFSSKFSFYSRCATKLSYESDPTHTSNDHWQSKHYGECWTGKSRLETVFNQGIYNINRVKRPKITAAGTTTEAKMYIAYFDSNDPKNAVKFRYGTVNTSNSFTNGLVDRAYSEGDRKDTESKPECRPHVIADKTTKYKGGEYAAVGVTSTGIAVAAWYDASAKQLVYSWNDTPQTLETACDTNKWQQNAKLIDKGYSGWYVDLAVDEDNGIHIAYFNSAKGDLKYAYLSSYTADPKVVTVDGYLSVGTNIMITTRKENGKNVPYISYYHASFNQTPNAVRVAWRSDMENELADGAKEDVFTQKWETMTIPVTNIPKQETICNGVPKAGTWQDTMIVGFMTDDGYKKAVLQK
ncbi:MAG: hypothetical protein ACTTH7_06050 [Treponema sp.]